MDNVLEVVQLKTTINTKESNFHAVKGISFQLKKGEVLGLVGESGSGKTTIALSIIRLVAPWGKISEGSVYFQGHNLTSFSEKEMQKIRGKEISMVFQEPFTSLHPLFTIGNQLTEPLCHHLKLKRKDAQSEAIKILKDVGFSKPENIFTRYPHELSGGMRQLVMIAMALSCRPQVMIADEPTSALDITSQALILNVLRELQEKKKMALLFISHDLRLLAKICDRLIVLYAGIKVEEGKKEDIFSQAKHPYTKSLLQSIPHNLKEKRIPLGINQPNHPYSPVTGCPFHPRCPHMRKICREKLPPINNFTSSHQACCWLHVEKGSAVDE